MTILMCQIPLQAFFCLGFPWIVSPFFTFNNPGIFGSTSSHLPDVIDWIATCREPQCTGRGEREAKGDAVGHGQLEEGERVVSGRIANEGVGTTTRKPDVAVGYQDPVKVFGIAECRGNGQFGDLASSAVNSAELAELELRKPDLPLSICRHGVDLLGGVSQRVEQNTTGRRIEMAHDSSLVGAEPDLSIGRDGQSEWVCGTRRGSRQRPGLNAPACRIQPPYPCSSNLRKPELARSIKLQVL